MWISIVIKEYDVNNKNWFIEMLAIHSDTWSFINLDIYNRIIIDFSKTSFRLVSAYWLQKIFTLKYKCCVCGKVSTKYFWLKAFKKIICSKECWEKFEE